MDWTELFICINGLAGHILIARQDRRGYWFWIAGNFAFIKLALTDERYGMAGLFVVYTIISLQALRNWEKKRDEPKTTSPPTLVREWLKSLTKDFLKSLADTSVA